jgi:uncharacterized RDD family membrane protein YckC
MPHASRGSRLLGQFLDGLVAASPVFLLVLLDTAGLASRVVSLAAIVFCIGYYLFADALRGGQSLGKRWLGMAVVDAESGAPCTGWQSFVRNVLLSILGPLDWVFIFGERHQRLGDKAAGTIVVDIRDVR